MKLLRMTFLLLAPLTSLAQVEQIDVTTLCRQGAIHSFVVDKINHCLEGATPRADIVALLKHIVGLHERVAALLGQTPAELLPSEKFTVVIGPNPGVLKIGGYGSHANGHALFLRVPDDWNRRDIIDSVYVHELTHSITSNPKSKIPKAMRDTTSSILWVEAIADLVAYTVTGTLADGPELPLEITRTMRSLSSKESFNSGAATFELSRNFIDTLTACRTYLSKNKATPQVAAYCGFFESLAKDNGVPPRSEGAFDPGSCHIEGERQCDNHYTGLAINSFLAELGSRVGKRPFDLLFSAFKKVGDRTDITWVCTTEGSDHDDLGVKDASMDVPEVFAPVMQALRDELDEKDARLSFDTLWASYGMEQASKLDALDQPYEAALRLMPDGSHHSHHAIAHTTCVKKTI